MILDELVLQGFGIYRERQIIGFGNGTTSRRPITLISALNGSGKTTLLDGLRLALYGRRVAPTRYPGGYERFLLDAIHRDSPPSEGASVSVAFRLRSDGTERAFRVTRQWTLRGEQVREDLAVTVNGQHDLPATEAWPDLIEQLLPLRLSAFCFFDGEKLEDLADPERSRDAVREAISSLLGLDLVDQLTLDLKTVERRARSKLADVDSDGDDGIDAVLARHRESDTRVQAAMHERGSAANSLDRAKLAVVAAQEAFDRAGGKLVGERVSLLDASRAAEARQKQATVSLEELAFGAAPLLLLGTHAISWAKTTPSASDDVLQVLAERDDAIIAELTRLGATATLSRKLAAYLNADREGRQITDGPQRPVSHRLRSALGLLGTVAEDVRDALAAREQAKATMESVQRALERIPNDASIRPYQQALADAMRAEAEATYRLRHADDQLALERDRRAKSLASYARAMEQKIASHGRLEESRLIEERTNDLSATLQSFRELVAARHATRIAEFIGDCLAQLHRKKGFLHSVHVDPISFGISLRNAEGRDMSPDRLSAGERQILAIATIWGILRASGRPLPLVIDTPLGRLDSVHRNALTDHFFAHASHQVVLLATDTEIDSATLARLRPRVSQAYAITYDDASSSSRVTPLSIEEIAA
ncbi:MAG: DNA sulfur modification protein DndD [Dyella sp.]|uniref:DNA sulfur modification protein DndD n=1 Tax=Dyella sp. TaxID=1869338 RepID=UPI003F7D6CEB